MTISLQIKLLRLMAKELGSRSAFKKSTDKSRSCQLFDSRFWLSELGGNKCFSVLNF